MVMTESDLIEVGGMFGALVPDELTRLRRLGYVELLQAESEIHDELVYRLTAKGREHAG